MYKAVGFNQFVNIVNSNKYMNSVNNNYNDNDSINCDNSNSNNSDNNDDMDIDYTDNIDDKENNDPVNLSPRKKLTAVNIHNMNIVYKLMSRGSNLIINNKFAECIIDQNKKNVDQHNKNVDQHNKNIIIYSGLCKTKQIIENLKQNNINYVLVYNIREIHMLSNINYLLKIKISDTDIGFSKNNLKTVLSYIQYDNCMRGVHITISKRDIIKDIMRSTYKLFHEISPYSHEVYRLMTNQITNILNELKQYDFDIRYVILDILDENNNQDNMNQSNVMFKMSIFNYIINLGIHNCSVS